MSDTKFTDCLFCPDGPNQLQKMPASYLPLHVAVNHVDKRVDEDGNAIDYICDGKSVKPDEEFPICSMERKFRTLAVSEFVEHVKKDHPNQELPFNLRYKAALSNFLTELCLLKSSAKNGSPEGQSSALEISQNAIGIVMNPQAITNQASGGNNTSDQVELSQKIGRSQQLLEDSQQSIAIPPNSLAQENPTAAVSVKLEPDEDCIFVEKIINSQKSIAVNTESIIYDGNSHKSIAVNTESIVDSERANGALESSDSEASNVESPKATTPSKIAGSSRRMIKKRKGKSFRSLAYRKLKLNLTARYVGKKGKDGNRPMADCSKCSKKIAYWCQTGIKFDTLINHAMTHMDGFTFQCKICGKKTRQIAAWHSHFHGNHPDKLKNVKNGSADYSDYYIDKREEMEEEIIKEVTGCFLSKKNE